MGRRWNHIANHVKTRNNRMCAQRWHNHLKPGARRTKKGNWTNDEDKQLRSLVKTHGCAWTKVGNGMPSHTDKQCRYRWVNYLDPELRHCPFTAAEDALLLKLHTQHGGKYKPRHYAQAMSMEGFPRSVERIKRRLNKIIKTQ